MMDSLQRTERLALKLLVLAFVVVGQALATVVVVRQALTVLVLALVIVVC